MGNSDALEVLESRDRPQRSGGKDLDRRCIAHSRRVRWDGMSDAGTRAPEGAYTAKLSIDYGTKYQSAMAETRSFVLDISAPTGTITLDPKQFTPNASGMVKPMLFTINARSALAHMESWSLDVFNPSGGLVNSWSGVWPNATVSWDGSSLNGGIVVPDSGTAPWRTSATSTATRDGWQRLSQSPAPPARFRSDQSRSVDCRPGDRLFSEWRWNRRHPDHGHQLRAAADGGGGLGSGHRGQCRRGAENLERRVGRTARAPRLGREVG